MSFGAEFLSCPDLFPARRAGEPWGEHAVRIDLPGGPYRIADLSAAQVEALSQTWKGYLLTDRAVAPRVEIRAFRAPAKDFRPFGNPAREYRPDVGYGRGAVRMAGLDLMALLEVAPADGGPEDGAEPLRGGFWTPREEGGAFRGACENFLRLVTAYAVLAQGGVLLHSAALELGTAFLFPGRSGAGKSTLCGLAAAAGFRVLGDELHAMTAELDLEPLPFAGDFGPTQKRRPARPLGAVVGLRQAAKDSLGPMSRAAAFALLLSTAPYVNRDPHRAGAVEEALTRLLERGVDLYELAFTPTSRLDVLRELTEAAA